MATLDSIFDTGQREFIQSARDVRRVCLNSGCLYAMFRFLRVILRFFCRDLRPCYCAENPYFPIIRLRTTFSISQIYICCWKKTCHARDAFNIKFNSHIFFANWPVFSASHFRTNSVSCLIQPLENFAAYTHNTTHTFTYIHIYMDVMYVCTYQLLLIYISIN